MKALCLCTKPALATRISRPVVYQAVHAELAAQSSATDTEFRGRCACTQHSCTAAAAYTLNNPKILAHVDQEHISSFFLNRRTERERASWFLKGFSILDQHFAVLRQESSHTPASPPSHLINAGARIPKASRSIKLFVQHRWSLWGQAGN